MIVYTPQADILQCPLASHNNTIYHWETITSVLQDAGIQCRCLEYCDAPQLVTYSYNLDNVLDINKVKRLLLPLKAACNSPNLQIIDSSTSHFAIQVPKPNPDIVYFKNALMSNEFNDSGRYAALLGRDTSNKSICLDIASAPHVLISGVTGAGKSVLLNTIITSMLFKEAHNKVKFIMIDVKQVELIKYKKLPHLFCPVITESKAALEALKTVCQIMDKRYKIMARKRITTLEDDKIIVVIDELADLILKSKKEAEYYIVRIAQLGRAAEIHLILATQRPTVNIITGLIKANIPCRIALQTASIRDSMNILDHKGAEQLLGRGDALLKTPQDVREKRFQSAYITDNDIKNVVDYWKQYNILPYLKRLIFK